MATIDASIVIIAMPAIFRGIHLNPLAPGNISYLLWMIIGYLLVQAVLVVTLGRLGDMFGRVKIYNLGFVVFTIASIAAVPRPADRRRRGPVADRLPHRPGVRRRDADGQLRRHPDRRVPGQPARHGAGHQPDRRHLRPVRRAAARWRAGRLGLARGVLGQRPDRRVRHGVGVPEPARVRHHPAGEDRLAGQRHLRAGRWAAAGGDHLRDPAVRRAPHRLDEPLRPRRPGHRHRPARRLLLHRAQDSRADVRYAAVPHPGLRGRQPGLAARRDRARRAAVHAGHLAGRDLAAAARLQLRGHAAVGGHLHAAADRGLPDRRADLRLSCPTGTASACSRRPGCSWPRVRLSA